MENIIEVTKENLEKLYWDAAMNIYYHDKDLPEGQYNLVQDFDENEIKNAIDNGVLFVVAEGEPQLFITAPFQTKLDL